MASQGAANSVRDAELLLAIDTLFAEGSHRCIVRGAAASTAQSVSIRQALVSENLSCVPAPSFSPAFQPLPAFTGRVRRRPKMEP